jgi:hypothetical protein
MRQIFFLIVLCILNSKTLATGGELFFFVDVTGNWVLKFETLVGEVYYDENFNSVNPYDLTFTLNGASTVKADFITSDNNFGTIDDYGHEFLVYYGKYKVTILHGSTSKYFYVDYKDCDYPGENYFDVDTYFKYDGINKKFIRTSNIGTGEYGDYTGRTFYISEFKYEPDIIVTTCFNFDITVRNLLNNEDYGVLEVDDHQINSGESIALFPGIEHNFETYNSFVESNYKFRKWDSNNFESYYNPEKINIQYEEPINASFFPTQSLTVTNYLEGGTSTDDFKLTRQDASLTYTLDYGTNYDAFIYQAPTNDDYTIEALPITAQRYGTNWTFLNWNTGSTSTTIQNIKVPDDLPPGGSFIANLKGQLVSNEGSGFSSNGKLH